MSKDSEENSFESLRLFQNKNNKSNKGIKDNQFERDVKVLWIKYRNGSFIFDFFANIPIIVFEIGSNFNPDKDN